MVEDRKQEMVDQPETEAAEGVETSGEAVEGSAAGLAETLARKEEEIKSLQERVLRLAAEMDNTRKRLEREKSEGISYANESLLRSLLAVIDNLERAIEHAEKDADVNTLLEGVRMTHKSFLDALSRFACAPFEAVGKPFDPNYHEAVMQQPSEDHPENTVIQEYQKGYTLHDRLLRPAMVVVSKGA